MLTYCQMESYEKKLLKSAKNIASQPINRLKNSTHIVWVSECHVILSCCRQQHINNIYGLKQRTYDRAICLWNMLHASKYMLKLLPCIVLVVFRVPRLLLFLIYFYVINFNQCLFNEMRTIVAFSDTVEIIPDDTGNMIDTKQQQNKHKLSTSGY